MITLYAYVSPASAIARGLTQDGWIPLQINPADLTKQQRDLLTFSLRDRSPETGRYFHDALVDDLANRLETMDQAGLVAALDAELVEIAEREAKRKQENLDLTAKIRKMTQEELDEYFGATWTGQKAVEALAPDLVAGCKARGDAKQAKKREEEARAKAGLQAADKAREDEKEAKTEAMKRWALEHGTDLLRRRINGGFDWEALARQQFADVAEIPLVAAGFFRIPYPIGEEWPEVSVNPRTTPTLEEIDALEKAQKLLGDAGKASLAHVKYTGPEDPNSFDGPETMTRTELEVEYWTLDSRLVTRYYQLAK